MVNIAREKYEHFRKLALETEKYLYYINSQGYFERVDKRKVKDFSLTGDYVFEKMKRTLTEKKISKTPVLVSRIQGKQYAIKTAVIRIIKNYDYDSSKEIIVHIDNDYTNCSADNLLVVNRGKTINSRWKRWRLVVNGREEIHLNTRSLCRRLGVSSEAFYSFINGRYSKNYWLNDIQIERVV